MPDVSPPVETPASTEGDGTYTPAQVHDAVSKAIATGDPAIMLALAGELEQHGYFTAVDVLKRAAQGARGPIASAPPPPMMTTPPFVPPVTPPQPSFPGVPQVPPVPFPQQPPPSMTLPLPGSDQPIVVTLPPNLPSLPVDPGPIFSNLPMPGGVVVNPLPQPPPAPPPAAVEQPMPVPQDTALLVAQMLADEGGSEKTWKKIYPALKAWQSNRGWGKGGKSAADGKFGPGTALAMAQEIGTLPIVRYWPKGTLPETALEPYRQSLLEVAATKGEPHRAQLINSANREEGQSFGPVKPITNRIVLNAA
jgi:hypothetical protein